VRDPAKEVLGGGKGQILESGAPAGKSRPVEDEVAGIPCRRVTGRRARPGSNQALRVPRPEDATEGRDATDNGATGLSTLAATLVKAPRPTYPQVMASDEEVLLIAATAFAQSNYFNGMTASALARETGTSEGPRSFSGQTPREGCGIIRPQRGQEDAVKKRFSVEQITAVLQQADQGVPIGDLCRKVGISEQSFYRWKKVYGGLQPSEARELKQLRDENTKLKRLVADLSLGKVMLQDVVPKKF
jgi:putative transposase